MCWGEFSNLKDVLSGIPQGSVLGPLLFVLYINDLPDSIKSFAKLFADDLKMIAKASDKLQVDNDFKMLELWESTWLLDLNVEKCKVLHTSFNNNPYNTYHLNGKVMLMSDQEKNLGVLTICNLLWNDKINSCVNKANQMICFGGGGPTPFLPMEKCIWKEREKYLFPSLSIYFFSHFSHGKKWENTHFSMGKNGLDPPHPCFIARNLISREKSLMLQNYKTLIRPNLEYCVQLWNPVMNMGTGP